MILQKHKLDAYFPFYITSTQFIVHVIYTNSIVEMMNRVKKSMMFYIIKEMCLMIEKHARSFIKFLSYGALKDFLILTF